jgi:2-alkenal reductase
MKKQPRLLVMIGVLVMASLACRAATDPFSAPSPAPSLAPTATAIPTSIPPTPAPVEVSAPSMIQEQDALISLYQSVQPGIVSIQITTADGGGAQGSGWVFDKEGHIVTNHHVVDGAEQIEVDFPSGFKAYAKLVGIDLDSDLAVIKVDAPAEQILPLTLGDSSNLQVGQTVIAIGNPFGLSGTMTKGIISALGRTLPSDRESPGGGFFSAGDLIQTDAPINPGNSGGPLFNINGEVIGVNRAIITDSSNASGAPTNSGIGFAISINIVKRVIPEIIKDGVYDYPYMGVSSLPDLSIEAIEVLGLSQYTGAYVTDIAPGSPAEQAGLRAGTRQTKYANLLAGGDLIIALDGRTIKNFDELLSYLINNKGPGDTVVLTILRGEEKLDLPLVLAARP